MRCFVSINIPEQIKQEINIIQKKIPFSDVIKGKKTELENLHLTLKFLGEINKDKLEDVKKRLNEIKFKKFETEINKIGLFDNQKKIILWLYLTNCNKLQRQIDEKLKDLFKPEKRFMSHLTIARIKEIKNKKRFLKELPNIKIPKIKFQIDNFYLMKSMLTSAGPKYEIISEYKLI